MWKSEEVHLNLFFHRLHLIFRHGNTQQQLIVPTATATSKTKKSSTNLTVHIKRVIDSWLKIIILFSLLFLLLLLLLLLSSSLFVIDPLQRGKQVGKVFFIAFAESPSACLYCFTQ
jgi:lipopolysaccharide/colanic/teichoic acid biosynthesis glycosyltransferase